MKFPESVRGAGALAFGLAAMACAHAAPGAAAAPAPAGARPAAAAAASVLPQWAQDKLAAARSDPKAHDKAYKDGAKLATFCANCHGPSGQSTRPDVPNLAGQNTVYVLNQLNKFHDGRRKDAFFMEGIVKGMSNDDRFAVAVYYTNQAPKAPAPAEPALAARGKAVYDSGCRKCHGDNGAGNETSPRLAGQQPDYLGKTIRRYREGNAAADEAMLKLLKGLGEEDIKALVAYVGAMR